MNQIFYAVDMGAPSKTSSGFFCWKYSRKENEVTPFVGIKGWYDCISSIVTDASCRQVHLTVEAALWGMKRKEDGAWLRRFHSSVNKNYTERPWYTGAGATTGLMAQEFFRQIVDNGLTEKIVVRESYISGLVWEGKQRGLKKPDAIVSIGSFSKHASDALEGLLLSLESNGINLDEIKAALKDKELNGLHRWSGDTNSRIKVRNGIENEMFALGVLRGNRLFDFQLGEILFTKREFKF